MEKFGEEKNDSLGQYMTEGIFINLEWPEKDNEDLEQAVGEFIYFHYLMLR